MQEVDRLGWAATTAFRVGPWAIGVRSNTLELDAVLRGALASHVLDGVEAPRNYSIAVHTDGEGSIRPLDAVWWQFGMMHQSRSAERVIRALFGYLGDHLEPGDELVRVAGVTLVGPGGAVVADASLGNRRSRLLPVLRKLQVQVVDSRWATIDDTGELVMGPPPLDVDEGALGSLPSGSRRAPSGPDLPVAPGRYPVRGWLVRPSVSGQPPSKAQTLSELVAKRTEIPSGQGERTLHALARSIQGAKIESFRPADLHVVESMLREITA